MEIDYTEDCFECNGEQTLSVIAIMDIESGEIVKFINQECSACGWNQQSWWKATVVEQDHTLHWDMYME